MKPVVIIVVFTAIKLSQGLQQLGGMVEEEDIRRSKTFFSGNLHQLRLATATAG